MQTAKLFVYFNAKFSMDKERMGFMAETVVDNSFKFDGNKKGRRVPLTGREKTAEILFYCLRFFIIADIVLMFFPSFNPARICEKVNKNLSLFTCGISYSTFVDGLGRAFTKGWIEESTFRLVTASCIVIIISSIAVAVCGCMSLGNNKLKRLGLLISSCGSVVQLVALYGIFTAYKELVNCAKPEKVNPMLPNAIKIYFVAAAIMLILSVVIFFVVPRSSKDEGYAMAAPYKLFLMLLPMLLLAFLFSYLPLFGWRYAFFDYKSGEDLTMDKFVGLKWFTQLFKNDATKRDIVRVLKDTFAMSALGIGTSWVAMVFAIFLSEIKNLHFRRFVQTFTTVPNFISWVLVYAIALAIFSTDGFVNTFLTGIGIPTTTNYLLENSHMWLKMLAWGLWKGTGWSAIIYIAAISGIDQQLYEAATVDGAGRFQKMWYITVPDLIPTYMVLLLMAIASILSNGMDQYLVFSNAQNKDAIEVLDLYVYNLGIKSGIIPMSTLIGMVKSLISVALLFSANGISKAIRGESIV